MKRIALLAYLAVTVPCPTSPAEAQSMPEAALVAYQAVEPSIIRIRTIADLEFNLVDPRTGEPRNAERPYSIDGTGVVVGETIVNGRTEYFVLTNHHVADASNYVLEESGYLRVNPRNTVAVPSVNETSYLLAEERDSITDADIRLVEVVRRVEGDMTLMRTEGANRELPTFDGRIGYLEGEIEPGASVVTGGYPWGGPKMFAVGTIVETDFPHQLGLPHEDFVVSLPVEPGQSGGPLFLVEWGEEVGEPVSFRLLGLVHAKDGQRNYAVDYRSWGAALEEFPTALRARMFPVEEE